MWENVFYSSKRVYGHNSCFYIASYVKQMSFSETKFKCESKMNRKLERLSGKVIPKTSNLIYRNKLIFFSLSGNLLYMPSYANLYLYIHVDYMWRIEN